jgi:hypothetical protein
MKIYHGTNKTSRNSIMGPPTNIETDKGGGEMGQGFYAGENMSMAIAWAKGRWKKPSVLEFEVSNKLYAQLSLKQLNHKQVLNDWQQMKRKRIHRIHKYGFDIVFGPLATNPFAVQYKFESISAESLLNNSNIGEIL